SSDNSTSSPTTWQDTLSRSNASSLITKMSVCKRMFLKSWSTKEW
ncbi:14856_t:CDS:2, partial [Dentiscutata heterogama]